MDLDLNLDEDDHVEVKMQVEELGGDAVGGERGGRRGRGGGGGGG